MGRYMAENILDVADANNPLVRANPTTNRAWTDADGDFEPDCDLLNPAANGECGQFSNQNFGRALVTTRWDEAILNGRRPYSWAGSVVFQHELAAGTALNVGYFKTTWKNFNVTDNLNLSPSDHSQFCITLPADPRLPGGGGNQLDRSPSSHPDTAGCRRRYSRTAFSRCAIPPSMSAGFSTVSAISSTRTSRKCRRIRCTATLTAPSELPSTRATSA